MQEWMVNNMGQALEMCVRCETKRSCDTCTDLHNWIMEHLEPKQEWISVKDDMPKEHDSIFARFYGTDKWKTGMYRTVSEDVIACLEAKNGHRMVKVLSTQDGDWKVNVIYQAEVTHWMPLPEPPEKNNEEEQA